MLSFACRVIWQDGIMFSSQHEASRGGVVTILSPHLHSVVIAHGSNPCIELFGYCFPLTIIPLELLMFMLPMMLWNDPRCGPG